MQVHPKMEHAGQLIHMECRAWFHGVIHDTKDKLGLIQFELHFEPKNWNGEEKRWKGSLTLR